MNRIVAVPARSLASPALKAVLSVAACTVLCAGCATGTREAPMPYAGTSLTPYVSTAPAIVCRGCEMR